MRMVRACGFLYALFIALFVYDSLPIGIAQSVLANINFHMLDIALLKGTTEGDIGLAVELVDAVLREHAINFKIGLIRNSSLGSGVPCRQRLWNHEEVVVLVEAT